MDSFPRRLIERAMLFEGLVEQCSVHLIISHTVRSLSLSRVPTLHPAWRLAPQVNESTVVGIRLLKPSLIFM
jgi:hypothetical protein